MFKSGLPLLGAFLVAAAAPALSQAVATGVKGVALSAFGGVAHVATDYNSTDYGFTLGADATRHYRLFDPSLEVRYTHTSGNVVGENSFAGGLKAERAYNRFHPNVDLEFGYGIVNFTHPTVYPTGLYSSDNSFLYIFGGGLDYDVTSRFAVKADYQVQSWNLGSNAAKLTPTIFTIGVLYRIPFKPLPGHRN